MPITLPASSHVVSGFSAPEPAGIWTNATRAELRIPVAQSGTYVFERLPFLARDKLKCQRFTLSTPERVLGSGEVRQHAWRSMAAWIAKEEADREGFVRIMVDLPDAAVPAELGLNRDPRKLGLMFRNIFVFPERKFRFEHGRMVGGESSKSYDQKINSGFWERYITGANVLDIGFRGYIEGTKPIVEGAIGVDLDYPGYDGRTLPFPDGSQDAVYTSHCLEHMPDPLNAFRDWWRVLKYGGHMIVVVPHAFLYERRYRPPSRWSHEHMRFYTPAALLREVESALRPNTYRVRHLADNDAGYDYKLAPEVHPNGCYEIELVIQKRRPPEWHVQDA